MDKILSSISSVLIDKMDVVVIFLIVAGGMYVTNIVLGSLNALFTNEFDWKKHFYGVAKAVVACLAILLFCVLLNLFNYGLSQIDIIVPDSVVTILQTIGVIVGWCYDLAIDIFDKIKGLKSLKYISYDDIKFQQNAQSEKGIG